MERLILVWKEKVERVLNMFDGLPSVDPMEVINELAIRYLSTDIEPTSSVIDNKINSVLQDILFIDWGEYAPIEYIKRSETLGAEFKIRITEDGSIDPDFVDMM